MTASKSDWVFGDEAAEFGVVESRSGELETDGWVVFAAGELVAGRERTLRAVVE